jgi:hypothetical protein
VANKRLILERQLPLFGPNEGWAMPCTKATWFTLFPICAILTSAAWATPKATFVREKPRIVDTETMIFASGGTIEINDSFGAVTVEGWDLAEVELTVIKTTHNDYPIAELPSVMAELDRVLIGSERPTDDHLIITTSAPPRKLAHPRGVNADVAIEYRMRVPRQTKLIIRHDTGNVAVNNIAGDMNVSARAGEVSLHLPANARFTVDAKAKRGEVCSELGHADGPAYAVHVRVGVGDISVRRLAAAEAETTVD